MKQLSIFLLLLASAELLSQSKPDFLPEDINSEAVEVRCFCKPGVRYKSPAKGIQLLYAFTNGGTLAPEEGNFTQPYTDLRYLHYFELDAKAPVLRTNSMNLLLGYQFTARVYRFDRIGADFPETFRELDARKLKSNSFTAYLTKSLNENSYFALRLRYSLNGDYRELLSLQGKYAIYRALGVYVRKPHEDLEWGIGATVSKSFRKFNAIPFVVFNKNFNDKWGMESALPGFIFFRRNFNAANVSLFGIEYMSQSYRLDVEDVPGGLADYAFNHSEVTASASWQHQFSSWIWGNVKAGYQLNFSTDFEAKTPGTTAFKIEPADGLFFNFSLFLSPPDEVLNK